MALSLFVGLNGAAQKTANYHTPAEQTGVAIGTGIGVAMVLFVWVLGTVILGFMMMFTRGRRESTTMERP